MTELESDWSIIQSKSVKHVYSKESRIKNWRTNEILPTYERKSEAGILIFNQDLTKLLAVFGRRSGKWGPPKGGVFSNTNESTIDAAIRETREESGYQFTVDDMVKFGAEPFHIVLSKIIFYVVIVNDNHVQHSENIDTDEISDIKWLTFSELSSVSVNAPIRQLLGVRSHIRDRTRLSYIIDNVKKYSN